MHARVCVCHIFTSTFISHSFMKMSSPNLLRIFTAVKMCLKKFCSHFKKTIWPVGHHSQ